jgi:hypothetical protein
MASCFGWVDAIFEIADIWSLDGCRCCYYHYYYYFYYCPSESRYPLPPAIKPSDPPHEVENESQETEKYRDAIPIG